MNTQLLIETANRLVDDDKGILGMNSRYKSRQPWQLSFSFGRALQQPVLEAWRGEAASFTAPQLFVIAEKLERMKLKVTIA